MNAYAPGLKVLHRCRHRCRRALPIAGTVLVRVGDTVAAQSAVAQTDLPGAITPVNVAHLLGISGDEVARVMAQHPVGALVNIGEKLAESSGIFGWFKRHCVSPVDGTVEAISRVTGQVMLRGPSRPVRVAAFLAGTVVEVLPQEGAVIEAEATFIQGIFGIGGEAYGPIQSVCASPREELNESNLSPDCAGAIVVGGGRVTALALARARALGCSAIITGGIDDQDLRDFLGYDLGVATTGSERVGLTLIITEGFGDVAMADRTWSLLKSRAGAEAACNGATQIRAGVLRPEIAIPWGAREISHVASEPPVGRPLSLGAFVRIIRDPYFGTIGTVARLPPEPTVLASGSRARVLEVRTAAGDLVLVPRANVELIEE
ncbi:MAG: hypothetical protein NT069_11690 [Planctomycetota bacterium]|nr:hypothetical protein [Planctomycetota bacterium]